MNCEKCHELLSDFIDGALPVADRARLARHLGECPDCAGAHDELSSIVATAREAREHLVAPPDERAMWLRIRDEIESDARANARAAAARGGRAAAASTGSLWSRLAGRRWALSLPQLATVTAGVAVAVALVTATGMRALLERAGAPPPKPVVTAQRVAQSPNDAMMIEYLKQRVEQRRVRWDTRTREAFDRNMSVVDETVNEMLKELDERPHDEVSEQALNAAMRDKIELLREFSEL
jgi:predicted anti-sigma-YlaC factor YlaD